MKDKQLKVMASSHGSSCLENPPGQRFESQKVAPKITFDPKNGPFSFVWWLPSQK